MTVLIVSANMQQVSQLLVRIKYFFSVTNNKNNKGSNIITVQKSKGDDNPPDAVSIREIGGSMAPIWKNMIESGKTQVC